MSIVKRIAFNTVVQIFGRIIGLFIMLITINLVSNYLVVDGSSVIGYGQYYIVFTYVSIIGVVADLGLYTLLIREVTGKSKTEVKELVGNAIGFRLILLLVTFFALGLLTIFFPYPAVVKIGIIIGIFSAFSSLFSQIFAALFQVNMVTYKIVISETLGRIAIAGLTAWCLFSGFGLVAIVVANLIGNLVVLFLSIFYAKKYCVISIKFNFVLWKKIWPELMAISVVTLLALVHFKIDSLILSFFRSAEDVGIYGLAYKLLEIIAIIPSIYTANVIPYMSQFHRQGEKKEIADFLKKSLVVMSAVAVPISILVFVFSKNIVVFISSIEFINSALPLKILIFAVLFAFIAEVSTGALTASRMQVKMVKPYIIAVVLNTAINFVIIPKYSYVGAAIVTVVTEAILMISLIWIARENIGKNSNILAHFKIILAGALSLGISYIFFYDYLPDIDTFSKTGKLEQIISLCISVSPFLILYIVFIKLFFLKKKKHFTKSIKSLSIF